jgi:outer membrane lipoprotein-sorting protein
MRLVQWGWLIGILSALVLQVAAQEAPSAQEILHNALDVLYPPVFQAQVHLEAIQPNEQPTITELTLWRKGSDKVLLEVTSEGVAKGQKILRVGDTLLILFPNICKVLPLDTKQSLFGSAFNVGDMARLDLAADYDPTVLGIESVDGQQTQAYKLELKAKAADAPYDRILFWVQVDDFLPLKAEFYTQSGKLLNEMRYEDPEELAGRVRPSKFVMTSTVEVGAQATVTFESMEALNDLPDEMFTEEALLKSCQNP